MLARWQFATTTIFHFLSRRSTYFIVQEFQFGVNWPTYSRFVGDIFGEV